MYFSFEEITSDTFSIKAFNRRAGVSYGESRFFTGGVKFIIVLFQSAVPAGSPSRSWDGAVYVLT